MGEAARRHPSEVLRETAEVEADASASPAPDAVALRLHAFRPVHGRPLRLAALVLPWVVLAAVAALLIAPPRDPMFISGVLAAAVAGSLFQVLLNELPAILHKLWRRGVFAVRQRPGAESEEDLGAAYLAFLDRLDRYLNSRLSWACGLGIAGALFMSFPARFSRGSGWWRDPLQWLVDAVTAGAWSYLGSVTLQLVLAFVLGLLLWRMGVIAVMVARLGSTFDFDLRLQHPDHSGGLRPLGDLCLTNALILSAPAIFLAGWLIVIPGFGADHNRYAAYVPYYESLLVVVFGLAVVAFALPLYAVHHGMLRQRARLQEPLYELGARIDELSRALRAEARTGTADRLDQLRKEQDTLTQVYLATSDIPTWPFDRAILRKFTIAQFIPLLSLTGIAPSIVATLERVFSS